MPPPTDTVTCVARPSVTLPSRVAVTVTSVSASSSRTEAGDTVRVIAAGAASSSVRVISALVTVKPSAAPSTSMVSSPSETLSCVGVRVNVPVPLAVSAGIVIVNASTAA